MRRVVLAAVLSLAPVAACADEAKPVIMQSLCKPKAAAAFDAFGFELINASGSWSVRVYPSKDAAKPVPNIEVPKANVQIVNSPKAGNRVILLSETVQQQGRQDSVIALSEVVGGKPEPFSVTVKSGVVGTDGVDRRPSIDANCQFANGSTPHERVSL